MSPSLMRTFLGGNLLLTSGIALMLVTATAAATELATAEPIGSAVDVLLPDEPEPVEGAISPAPPPGPALDTQRAEDQLAAFKPSTQRIAPSFSSFSQEIVQLDNGLLVQGDEVRTQDGYTSGFRLTAGFAPQPSDYFDLGAELRYRESNDVPTRVGGSHVQDVTSIGGSLIAGLRVGAFGLYGKAGYAQWSSDPVTGSQQIETSSGEAHVKGIGARWLADDGWIGQLEMEEIDHPMLEHLNMLTASVHIPF